MKTIPLTYQKNGFDYKLVRRSVHWAIYSQTFIGREEPCHWELCRVRRHNGYEIHDKKVVASEYLPGTHDWGRMAWTLWTLREAVERLEKLEDSTKDKT